MDSESKEKFDKTAGLVDLIRNIRKMIRMHFMKKMREHEFDITIEMLEILSILWQKDNINQQEIVDRTNRNKASITSLIDNLAARSLVQRNPDPTDRRNNLIALTKEGQTYQKKLMPVRKEIYEFFDVLSEEELDSLTQTLHKLYKKMGE